MGRKTEQLRLTSNQARSTSSGRDPLGRWLASVSRAALLGAGLIVAPTALGADMVYDGPEGPVAVASDFGSVLVEKREGEPLPADRAPELEPISQVSDYEPELADPPEPGAPPESISKASHDEEDASADGRVAALPKDGGAVLEETAESLAESTDPTPVKFYGVTPGESTRDGLIEAWGEPSRVAQAKGQTTGGEVLGYELEPFQSVEALVEDGTVAVVRVTLGEETSATELTERLRLTEIETTEIADPATGELLAIAFPEKGLTLLVATGTSPTAQTMVSHLVLEPIDPRAFVLRAEQRAGRALNSKLADLDLALAADPGYAHAHWYKAEQHLAAGQAAEAEQAAAEAVRLAPENPAYRLTYAEALQGAAEFDKAVIETRKVLDDTSAPPIVRAQALDLMGRLASLGAERIASKTIDFHNAAIEIADGLATSTDDDQRRRAKDVLVSAHLAVARAVATKDYNDKADTMAAWIGRASGIAEERIASDDGGLELRLQVAREALGCLALLRPTMDPGPWVAEAQETADELLAERLDPLFRARVHWELGVAYQHAVRIEHVRGDAQQALAYGSRSIAELSEGAEPRATSPAAERLVGELYFYLGAVNAVHKQDHAEAVGWYDKGRDILMSDRPGSEFVVPRRDGEELVSMGVSYWTEGQRDLAIEVTQEGARLMERAVQSGVSDKSDLAVPYGNLATMYKKVENGAKALEYNRLMQGVAAAKPPAPAKPATSKPPVAKQASRPTAQQRQPQASQQTPAQQESPRTSPSRIGQRTVKRTLTR